MRIKINRKSGFCLLTICLVMLIILGVRTPFSLAQQATITPGVTVVAPPVACGDGYVHPNEECDDGNNTSGDGCDYFCRIEVCGNTYLQAGEDCDDGNTESGDGCDSECVTEYCSDGIVNNVDEVCDDGGVVDGDGCAANCFIETGYICLGEPSCCSSCGDFDVQCSEKCDDGKHCMYGIACTSDADCSGIGDGACRPRDGDGCSDTCRIESAGSRRPPELGPVIEEIVFEMPPGQELPPIDFHLYVMSPDTGEVLWIYPILLSTDVTQEGHPPIYISGVNVGDYVDVGIKGTSHLTRIMHNYQLGTDTALNFPLFPDGTMFRAGDLDSTPGVGNSTGDDVINSVDLSVMLDAMGTVDPDGKSIPANLNGDSIVNEQDLNILLYNLDMFGESSSD